MNKLWGVLIIISIICAVFNGSINNINDAIFKQMKSATDYILNIGFLMAFWAGINNIIINTKLKDYFKFIFKPLFKLVYGKSFNDDLFELMSLNFFGNLIGIGNVSTISGLKVIDELNKQDDSNSYNKDFSDDITIFTVLNTASIQLLPITILNIRYSLGANDGGIIIKYVWIVSFVSFLVLVIVTKIYLFIRKRIKINDSI